MTETPPPPDDESDDSLADSATLDVGPEPFLPGMANLLARCVGLLAVGVGAVLFWLPIPLGAPLIAVGTAILIGSSRTTRRRVRRMRRERPSLDEFLARLESWLPSHMARQLRRTRGRRFNL